MIRAQGLMLAVVAVALAGCNDTVVPDPQPVAIIGRISLGVDSVTVTVGDTLTLIAKVYDIRGATLDRLPDGQNVSWTSSNGSVATVNDGLILGVSPGRSIITARAGGQLAAARVGVVPRGGQTP